MITLAYDFLPIFFLIGLGCFLGIRGFFTFEMVEGLKRIVASIALPALLFGAFSRVHVDGKLGLLALGIYASCGVMGLIGYQISRISRLPSPSSVFLFQGFEAGMLGYGLFVALFGQRALSSFATADLGQVLFVFTILMTQLRRSETGGRTRPLAVMQNMIRSPVIISIVSGLLASVIFPGALGSPWADHGALFPLLTTVGALTTPLVCLVVGFGLKDFQIKGAGQALTFVFVRLGTAIAMGSLIAFVMVSALGFPKLQSFAVLFLFILPPPFVIPVFRTSKDDASYISSVLSIYTLASIIVAVILAAVAGEVRY